MAEWPIASVLKTEVLQGTVGSNPTSSVLFISSHCQISALLKCHTELYVTNGPYGLYGPYGLLWFFPLPGGPPKSTVHTVHRIP